jgi:hypothetical protein
VAGLPTWYDEGPQPATTAPLSSLLRVKAGECYIEVRVRDRSVITRSELFAMFEGATFDDCTDSSTGTGSI